MNKILDKIRGLFKEDNKFIKDESLKAVHTWLEEEKINQQKPTVIQKPIKRGYDNYKKISNEAKNQETKKIADFLSGAKTKFTEEEFADRKTEILNFLNNLKTKK